MYRIYPRIIICLGLLTIFSCQNELQNGLSQKQYLDYVDTRVGTAYSIADLTVTEVEEPSGYVSPIVGNPSALTHWTPQTSVLKKRILTVPVPYWYEDKSIQGFRGTRYPNGAVVSDWGALSLMPMTGKVATQPTIRASKFSHDSEIAKPHYYSVILDDYRIKGEVTAAAKTGFFQFTYPKSDSSSVVFDGVFSPGEFRIIPEKKQIEGTIDVLGDFKSYFVAQFDKEFETYGLDLKKAKLVGSGLIPGGIKAEFFNNIELEGNPVLVVKDTMLNYDWPGAPYKGVKPDNFSARYTANMIARHQGIHTIELTTDDGTRLYINDKLVLDSWVDRGPTTDNYSFALEKGEQCAIRIEYYERWGGGTVKLRCAEPIEPDPALIQKLALQGNEGNAAYVSFPTIEGEKVKVKVATSLISLAQARLNMQEEFPHFNFEKATAQGVDIWEKEFNKIQVEGAENDKAIFYTALTKCLVNPRDLNEMGQYFSPFDLKVHKGKMYTDLSLWDTFRSLHPLWVLIKPDATTDVINGMLNAYKEGGWIPKWPNPYYRSIMMGTHGDAVIADAYMKGIRGFDTELAFEAMLKNANQPGDSKYSGRVGIMEYNELGYVPSDVHGESVARTLEFAYDDYCISEMAKALGKEEAHKDFQERSLRYQNVLDQETGLIRGKTKTGEWLAPYAKNISVWARGNEHDTEAYYRNHTLLVPHDIDGLAKFMGGPKAVVDYLDDFFTRDMYYVGDEFSMHAPFMYNEVGAPWKTQKVVRDILARYFFDNAGGLPGNDDCGQVSSWYVFGAMGFYPACPGKPIYQICSPIFDKMQMKVGNEKVFTIIANNNSKENTYIQSATLNGEPYNLSWLHHDAIMEGGTFVFEMGPTPNKAWGIGKL